MSTEGSPPAPTRSQIPLWVVGVAVVVMLALAGGVVVLLRQDQASPKAPRYPAAWDQRMAPYAEIAERERGLDFRHPVPVRFLSAASFEKELRSESQDLDAEDREEIEQFAALMRALGLLEGGVDLADAFEDAMAGGALAYYSPDDEQITVRGDTITESMKPTLVHELTHALQDQHFRIGDRQEELAERDDDRKPGERGDAESTVLDAVIEGDAVRTEGLYRETLTAAQRRRLDRSEESQRTEALARIKGVPKFVITMISSPYTLGEGLVTAVSPDGKHGPVDDLFTDTPVHETALYDPFRYLDGDTDAVDVEVPELGSGEDEFDSGEFGVVTWYLMLAERIPLQQALAAADGWGGDAYVGFARGDDSCIRLDFAGREAADTTRMETAVRRWAAAGSGTPATVSRNGELVRLESCDPGTSAAIGKDDSEKALTLLATRTGLAIGVMRGGVPRELARCLAGGMVREYSLKQLQDPQFGSKDPAVQARLRQLATACR